MGESTGSSESSDQSSESHHNLAIIYTLEQEVRKELARPVGRRSQRPALFETTTQCGLLLTNDPEIVCDVRLTTDKELEPLKIATDRYRHIVERSFSLQSADVGILYAVHIPNAIRYGRTCDVVPQYVERNGLSHTDALQQGLSDFTEWLSCAKNVPNYLVIELPRELWAIQPKFFRSFGAFMYNYGNKTLEEYLVSKTDLASALPEFEKFVNTVFVDRYLNAVDAGDIVETNQIRFDLGLFAEQSPFHQMLLELDGTLAAYKPGQRDVVRARVQEHLSFVKARVAFTQSAADIAHKTFEVNGSGD